MKSIIREKIIKKRKFTWGLNIGELRCDLLSVCECDVGGCGGCCGGGGVLNWCGSLCPSSDIALRPQWLATNEDGTPMLPPPVSLKEMRFIQDNVY